MAYTARLKLWRSCLRTLQALTGTILLVYMVVAVCGTEPLSGDYRFELTHVDANRGFSNDELMRRAIDRSRLRAAALYGTHATDYAASGGSPIFSPAHVSQSAAEYFMVFYMGMPKVRTSAVADTGSNLIWVVNDQCAKSKSNTLPHAVLCSDDMCKNHVNCHCVTGSKLCRYSIKYGGNKNAETEGVLYKDQLTFPVGGAGARQHQKEKPDNTGTFKDVAIGCSNMARFPPQSNIHGIVGLGRGAQSLPGQLKFDKFSYCLNNYAATEGPSWLLFRTVPDLTTGARPGAALATTVLWRNEKKEEYKTWYFVNLERISVDGTGEDITLQSGGTSGNMFIDSGASYTRLEESAFNKVVEKVDQIMKEKGHIKQPQQDGERICYKTATNGVEGMPQMVLHFADSADMFLPWESYLWHSTQEATLCLTILKATGISFLGNYQQQSIHMLFDTKNEKLSFVPADCSMV